MVSEGLIMRLSPGRYYKPKNSLFGTLKPSEEEVVKDLLFKDDVRIGYLTGYSVFNGLGLTTQVPNVIQIGVNKRKKNTRRGFYDIKFVTQPNTITEENYRYLQILDAIRYIKDIPDSDINSSVRSLLYLFTKFTKDNIDKMMMLVENYNPMTRALTGAIIEKVRPEVKTDRLFSLQHPLTIYKLGISEEILPTTSKWNLQ